VLEAAETEANWFQLWIASGVVATLVVKIAVANYGLSLMTLADPFVVCAGEFLASPEYITRSGESTEDPSLVKHWMRSKMNSIRYICMSQTIFWGAIVHLSLVNLFITAYEQVTHNPEVNEELQLNDMRLLTSCVVFTSLILFGGHRACKYIRTYEPEESSSCNPSFSDRAVAAAKEHAENYIDITCGNDLETTAATTSTIALSFVQDTKAEALKHLRAASGWVQGRYQYLLQRYGEYVSDQSEERVGANTVEKDEKGERCEGNDASTLADNDTMSHASNEESHITQDPDDSYLLMDSSDSDDTDDDEDEQYLNFESIQLDDGRDRMDNMASF